MFRNYLMAALRRLGRDRLHAGATIFSLALGFTAAILMAVFVRDEMTYEHVFADHARIYDIREVHTQNGAPAFYDAGSGVFTAALIKTRFPEIEQVARLVHKEAMLSRGQTSAPADVVWVDATFFDLFPLHRLKGEALGAALARPDTIVLTRSLARKYFGDSEAVGQTIDLNPAEKVRDERYRTNHPMLVTAVIEDLPSETHIKAQAIAAGVSSFSPVQRYIGSQVHTYFRTPKGPRGRTLIARMTRELPTLPIIVAYAPDATSQLPAPTPPEGAPVMDSHLEIQAIDGLHWITDSASKDAGYNIDMNLPGMPGLIPSLLGLAVLILLIAGLNFVVLMTARAATRSVEIGVRKALGATRLQLVIQFMGEVALYVALALLLSTAAAELILPGLNRVLHRTMTLDYFGDPWLLAIVAGGAVGCGLLSGLLPALAFSSIKPAAAFRGILSFGRRSRWVRQGLVMLQFSALLALALTAITFHRQSESIVARVVRPIGDPVLTVFASCTPGVRERLAQVQGVRAVICGYYFANASADDELHTPDGRWVKTYAAGLGYGYHDFFAMKLVAGRSYRQLPQLKKSDSQSPPDFASDPTLREAVINETARRTLGFTSAQAAVGQTLVWRSHIAPTQRISTQIVGVLADEQKRYRPPPTINLLDNSYDQFGICIKIARDDMAGTLGRLDAAWKAGGELKPLPHTFLDQTIRDDNADIIILSKVVGVGAGLAVLIAGLGLFALSAFAAERRTKEIGIRKAMGAYSRDVLTLLMLQFIGPVVAAMVAACPLTWLGLRLWQARFAQPVSLNGWLFLAAAAGALLLAGLTVFFHALTVARQRPVQALRYE